jgi:hypothetical protein
MDRRWRYDLATVTVFTWSALALGLAVFGFLYPWSHTVYDIYARAGRNWWLGKDLYATPGTAYFRYSPLFAIGLTPFAAMLDPWGNALWRLVNCFVYAAGLFTLGRQFFSSDPRRSQLAVLFLLVLPLSLHSLYNAQANLLMLGCVMLGVAAATCERWNRAAIWIAVATLIKGYPVALALLLMALYPRRFTLRFLAALCVGLLLPFGTQAPAIVMAQYASWWQHLRDSTVIMRERLRSLDHLFSLAGHALPTPLWLGMQILAGLSVLGFCLVAARRMETRGTLTLTFLLYSVWVALFGPATEASTYVVMAPAAAWALISVFAFRETWLLRGALIGSLLLMGPVTTDMVPRSWRNFANEHGSEPIGALLFLASLLLHLRQSLLARTGPTAELYEKPSRTAA